MFGKGTQAKPGDSEVLPVPKPGEPTAQRRHGGPFLGGSQGHGASKGIGPETSKAQAAGVGGPLPGHVVVGVLRLLLDDGLQHGLVGRGDPPRILVEPWGG